MENCSNVPQVKVQFMNDVHCEEWLLVDRLRNYVLESIQLGEPHLQIDEELGNWISHTVSHFERENKYMREYNFPAYLMHSGEHERALRELKMVELNWKNSKDLNHLANYIENWRNWFYQHINTMDTMTAHFLSQFGVNL